VDDIDYRRNGGDRGRRAPVPRLPMDLAHSVVEQARADLTAAGAMLALGTATAGIDVVATTGFGSVDVDAWRHIDADDAVPPADCLRTGVPVSCETPAERAVRYPVLVGSQAWTDATACVPIRRGEQVAGVLAIAFRGSRSLSVSEWDRLAELAEVCGRQLAAEAGAEDVYGPPPGLADSDRAARVTTLSRLGVADGEVGGLVDWLTGLAARLLGTEFAQVSLLGDTEQVIASAAGFTVAEDVRRTPLADSLCTVCVAHGAPLVIEDATSHPWVRELPPVRFGGVRRYLGAPLIAPGGVTIGALCAYDRAAGAWPADAAGTLSDLATAAMAMIELRSHTRELEHRVDAQDLAYAQALSHLTAQAALLAEPAEWERAAAHDLQARLLPGHPGPVPGAEVALRYRPADDLVGGDWHDVFALPGGRTGIVVGDVVGNHLRAILTMGALHAVVRGAAGETGPAGLLERLDTAAAGLGDRTGATVGYAEYDPVTARLRYSCAAHLPPLLVHEGRAHYLWGARGIPVGVRPIRRAQAETEVPRGAMLVWCTDGLVSRRGERLHAGLERLAGIAAALADRDDPGEFADAVLAALLDGRRLDDDVVLACLRLN
jgi:serine phosphatase RsbU (regulator of sigma subunit)